jgi:hypothetical protein
MPVSVGHRKPVAVGRWLWVATAFLPRQRQQNLAVGFNPRIVGSPTMGFNPRITYAPAPPSRQRRLNQGVGFKPTGL